MIANNLAAIMFDQPVTVPNERKAMELDPKQLEPLVGRYELAPNVVLTVTAAGAQLFVPGAGQPRAEVFPGSETNFFAKAVDAQITFNKDTSGKVFSVIFHQNGDPEAKRLKD
jgi:hypothetical protein